MVFWANVLRRMHWEIVLASVYFKCGEDINSPANAQAAFFQELATPWSVIGDFQVPPEQRDGHHLLNVRKAEIVCSGQPATIHGAKLDYILAGRTVAPFIDVNVTWNVPWRPHAGVVIRMDKAAPRPALAQLTHVMPIPKLEDPKRQWDEFKLAPRTFWLGRPVGPKEMLHFTTQLLPCLERSHPAPHTVQATPCRAPTGTPQHG